MWHADRVEAVESLHFEEHSVRVRHVLPVRSARRALASDAARDLVAHRSLHVRIVRHQQQRPEERLAGRLEACVSRRGDRIVLKRVENVGSKILKWLTKCIFRSDRSHTSGEEFEHHFDQLIL